LKGRYLGVERVEHTCCTRELAGEKVEARGPEYLLDVVLVGVELFLMIMISKCGT
jgi:hypothetical protein